MRSHPTLYAVILPIPASVRRLQPRSRNAALSQYARQALKISAQKSGWPLGKLVKASNGSPLPSNGIHWSLTHKPRFVGAVTSRCRIGIDLEYIQPRSPALFQKIGTAAEWNLADKRTWKLFFRFWTSKEAVLKAAGIGLAELSQCRVSRIIDETHLVIHYRQRPWQIEHCYFNGHIASVLKNSFHIQWIVL